MSKRSRSSVKSSSGKVSQKKKSKLTQASKTLRANKLAAARLVANAATMGFLGIEKKFLDCYKTATNIAGVAALTGGIYPPTGGCTNCISCPPQNDTASGRDGKRYVIDSLIFKGAVELPFNASAATFPAVKVFLALILDSQSNGAPCTSETIFTNPANVLATVVDPLKNLLHGKRFRILKSQVFDLTPDTLAPTATNYIWNAKERVFDWYIPFKGGLPVNMNAGTNADVANVIDNSLHVVAFASSTGLAQGPKIMYNARIRFTG